MAESPSSILVRNNAGRHRFGERDVWIYDVEVFPNYFCVTFLDGVDVATFDHHQIKELTEFVSIVPRHVV